MLFRKLPLNAITALTLVVGLIRCGRNEVVNSGSSREENSAMNASATAKGERPLVVATTSVLCDLTSQVAHQTVDCCLKLLRWHNSKF